MHRARIHLICGPSSAGKSRYIAAHGDRYDAVLFPDDLGPDKVVAGKRYAMHYNLMRPTQKADALRRKGGLASKIAATRMKRRLRSADPFDADPALGVLFALPADISASVLVVPRSELERRMLDRTDREPLAEVGARYRGDRWVGLLREVDLEELYAVWIAHLETRGIPVELLASKDGDFSELPRGRLAAALGEGR